MTTQSQSQAIEKLAKFIGLKKRTEYMGEIYYWYSKDVGGDLWMEAKDWDPFTDRNHLQMVLNKVMEDEKLLNRFIFSFSDNFNSHSCMKNYMKATPEQILSALLPLINF